MTVGGALAEIRRRDPILYWTGWLHVGLLAGMLVAAFFDHRAVMGLNPWIKPMKFAVSITVYVWTVAWLIGELPGPPWARWSISRGVSLSMILEILCISLQAARGTTSHYNVSTLFDAVVFQVMGSMIGANTALAVLLLVLFWRRLPAIAPSYLWGIRLALLIFIGGSLVGVAMILHNAHTVGAADGGPGLPLVNWSTRAGDLRVAHLLGLHALQVIPLAGWLMSRARRLPWPAAPTAVTVLVALAYAALMGLTFVQARAGQPLIPL